VLCGVLATSQHTACSQLRRYAAAMMLLVLSAGLLWTLLCLIALLMTRILPDMDVHVRWPHMVTVYVDTEALNR